VHSSSLEAAHSAAVEALPALALARPSAVRPQFPQTPDAGAPAHRRASQVPGLPSILRGDPLGVLLLVRRGGGGGSSSSSSSSAACGEPALCPLAVEADAGAFRALRFDCQVGR
jgi:hypothetical protein